MRDLEERLEWLNRNSVIIEMRKILRGREFGRAKGPVMDKLFERIVKGIDEHSETEGCFQSQLQNHLTAPEAKIVYYGILALGEPQEKTSEVLNELSDWEKVYFFAGAWAERDKPRDEQDVTDFVRNYIHAGTDRIYKKLERARTPIIPKTLPESEDYYATQIPSKETRHATVAVEFEQMLMSEELLEGKAREIDAIEATAIFLDSCSDSELRYLTQRFGKEAVGGEYALSPLPTQH